MAGEKGAAKAGEMAGGSFTSSLSVEDAILTQHRACLSLQAPCTGRIMLSQLAILQMATDVAQRMRDWPKLSQEHALPLRMAGGLHNLYLTGDAPELGAVYSGELTDQGAIDALVAGLAGRFDARLAGWLDGPPQTNEAGRSAGVMTCLLWLSERLGLRFELNEIGASAGINTMMERYFFDLGGTKVGPRDSPMQLVPDWRGPAPPAADIEITAIRGSDIALLDLSDKDEAMRLKSFVWPDVADRMQRIDAAITLAAQRKPDLVQADAGDWVPAMLAQPQEEGVTRVLYHSIMWQYMPADTRERITKTMDEAGALATPERPLAWVQFETNPESFAHEQKVKYWAGDRNFSATDWTVVSKAHPHGAWVEWLIGEQV